MSDPFIGEIKMFGGNFAPRGYALCNGQIMPIAQNTALYSILGVNYGGDGRTNFALPNMQSRVPMHWGNGAGLSSRILGENGGEASVTLLSSQMPLHNHSLGCNEDGDGVASPQANTFTGGERGGEDAYASQSGSVSLAPQTVGNTGGGQPHNNTQPYLGLTFIIALQGIFPQRP